MFKFNIIIRYDKKAGFNLVLAPAEGEVNPTLTIYLNT